MFVAEAVMHVARAHLECSCRDLGNYNNSRHAVVSFPRPPTHGLDMHAQECHAPAYATTGLVAAGGLHDTTLAIDNCIGQCLITSTCQLSTHGHAPNADLRHLRDISQSLHCCQWVMCA